MWKGRREREEEFYLSVFIGKNLNYSLLSGGQLLLGEEGVSLVNSHAEEIVALQNHLDFVDAEIDKHTSNLWSLVTLQMLDKVVDCGTHLLLVVWVLGSHSLDDRDCLLKEGLLDTGWLSLGETWLSTSHWLSSHLTHWLSGHLTHWLSSHLTHWFALLSHWHVLGSALGAASAISGCLVVAWLLVEVSLSLLSWDTLTTVAINSWNGIWTSSSLLVPEVGWELL